MITIQIGSYLIDFMQIITFWEVWWDGNVNKKNNYSPKHYSVIVYYFPIKQTDLINNIASRAMNNININRFAARINSRLFLMISTMSVQWHSVCTKRTYGIYDEMHNTTLIYFLLEGVGSASSGMPHQIPCLFFPSWAQWPGDNSQNCSFYFLIIFNFTGSFHYGEGFSD